MTLLYTICAIMGGTVLVCQFVLSIIGLGHADDVDDGSNAFGHDVGHDAVHDQGVDHAHDQSHEPRASSVQVHRGPNWFFGVVSFRTVMSALTFFGLTGRTLDARGESAGITLLIAVCAGVAAMYLVHWMMRSLALLRADGTVRIERSVGAIGTVYVRIPARKSGPGKVHLTLQSQTVEVDALTEHEALATGSKVVVTRIVGSDTVEVAPAERAVA
ncbi:MAG TPA: hypothetical protein VG713_03745 [Pirellulales bacterium]|nr:hypothetical protein [Pirellulales bacterium]